ncbi:hypothetical protein YB2330_000241 [Saitoella coloradoensis]
MSGNLTGRVSTLRTSSNNDTSPLPSGMNTPSEEVQEHLALAIAGEGSAVDELSAAATEMALQDGENEDEAETKEGKFKGLLSILRRFIGIKDLASVRFSLPAQFLEPIPNLDYWHYIDRPDALICITEPEESVDRMLAVLRWWFTKDLKVVKGKPCKPYNCILGEFFRAHWDVREPAFNPDGTMLPANPDPHIPDDPPQSSASSVKSAKSASTITSGGGSWKRAGFLSRRNTPQPTSGPTLTVPKVDYVPHSERKVCRVAYVTEQVSHHPPVSAYYASCAEKGIVMRGLDQVSAKFTGTSIKVFPGEQNRGVWITLKQRGDEEYLVTHTSASVSGFLMGSPTINIHDASVATCPKTKTKAIVQYLEESWLGKQKALVKGAIFTYDPANDTITDPKDVPSSALIGTIEGSWKGEVFYTPKDGVRRLLVDLELFDVFPKKVPESHELHPNESHRVWEGVTKSIKSSQFSKATKLKVDIEERQRAKAKKRLEEGTEHEAKLFKMPVGDGKPELSELGEKILAGVANADYGSMKDSIPE